MPSPTSTPKQPSPSQDSQPVSPGQRPSDEPAELTLDQARSKLSKAASTVVNDELSLVERQSVAMAILEDKKAKLQAMVDGSREVPREHKAIRNLPGLGPSYKFSAELRLKTEEWAKEQDHKYVEMLLEDLVGKVIPGAIADMQDILANCYQRMKRKIEESEVNTARFVFDEVASDYVLRGDELLKERRKPKRKASTQPERRPSKRPRQDGEKSHQNHQHRKRQYKPKQNKK